MRTGDLGGRRLGGFELVEPLGAGAFATVWRARQLRLGRDVAVKVLDPVLARNPDAARRFEREGRAAASLDHPAIVPVYEAGEADGIVYLAMRLVTGPTLAQRLAGGSTLDTGRLVEIVDAVASALDHAHARGLVHRDVKPSNILLEGDAVWLADFGIAALATDVGRYTAGAIGTAAYMAPEQARPGELDHRADLYALGCVVHECVTGAVPFPADDLVAALLAHASSPVPPTGDPALDGFFARALAKAPEDRFATGAELVASLRTALGGAHVPADTVVSPAPPTAEAPASAPPRARRTRRRAAVAGAVAVVVLAGVVAALLARGDDDRGVAEADLDAGGGPVVEQLVQGGTVVSGWRGGRIESPNPHVDLDAEGLVSGNVLPPLYALDEDGAWVPHLADGEPEVLATEPLQLRWRLRPDAVWDDGTPISATDVERTYRYLRDPASGALGVALYERIADVLVEDATTFTITFAQPLGEPRVLFSTIHPVLRADSLDAWLATGGDPAGYLESGIDYSGGPFLLTDFETDREARLVRNDAWWGPAPHLDRVVVLLSDSGGSAVDGVVTGELDVALVEVPQQDDLRRAEAVDGVEARLVPGSAQFGLQFNLAAPGFDDVRVRRAVLLALDRPAISETVSAGASPDLTAPPGSFVFFPGQDGYEDRLDATRDVAEASRLLDEAGWPLGTDGVRLRDGQRAVVDLVHPTGGFESARLTALAVLVAEHLADVGIVVEPRPVSGAELAQAWTTGAFELTLSVSLQAPDPMVAVERYSGLRCPATVDGCGGERGLNYWSYANPTVTDLLERSDRTLDQQERRRLLVEADRLMALDLPGVPIAQPPALVVADEQLRGLDAASRAGPLGRMAAWAYAEN